MGMTLFLLGLLISGSAAIVLALVILQHREANGALPFALVMIASAIWAWGYALQISAVSIDLALIAMRIRYIWSSCCSTMLALVCADLYRNHCAPDEEAGGNAGILSAVDLRGEYHQRLASSLLPAYQRDAARFVARCDL